jgi:hypothetical protein
MKKYNFPTDFYEETNEIDKYFGQNIQERKYLGKKNVIMYKCLICNFVKEWDNNWTDEKKAEVKAEVDAHHNEHIIPDEITP